MNKRVEWIDTAKGICILLVVLHHLFANYGMYGDKGVLHDSYYFLQSFRIPLYYILSGLFFKEYGGIRFFIIKKTNKILIPCLFFYFTLSVMFPWLSLVMSKDIFHLGNTSLIELLLSIIVKEGNYPNGPIWFLLCLFQINIIFYIIHVISGSMKSLMILCCLFGIIGLLLSHYGFNLYCNTDSALTGMPFFGFGYFLRNKTEFISEKRLKHLEVLVFATVSLLIVFLLARNAEFNFNLFANKFTVYPCGIIGGFSVLMISKNIGRIPCVSYWGRYSIIVLVTHYFLINIMDYCLPDCLNNWFVCFLIIMSLYFVIIPLFLKYLPYVTAQKDCIVIEKYS
jgi:fucose 4-O-acetylase-like acetyltransferase